jgi:hypothetical protein
MCLKCYINSSNFVQFLILKKFVIDLKSIKKLVFKHFKYIDYFNICIK